MLCPHEPSFGAECTGHILGGLWVSLNIRERGKVGGGLQTVVNCLLSPNRTNCIWNKQNTGYILLGLSMPMYVHACVSV